MRQPRLFGDHTWTLGRRTAHVVPRNDGTGYTVRIRWSHKLGLQLDHVFVNHARAARIAEQIALRGRLDMSCWKRIFYPKWTPHCETIRSAS